MLDLFLSLWMNLRKKRKEKKKKWWGTQGNRGPFIYGVSGIEIIIPMLEASSFSWFPRKKKKVEKWFSEKERGERGENIEVKSYL